MPLMLLMVGYAIGVSVRTLTGPAHGAAEVAATGVVVTALCLGVLSAVWIWSLTTRITALESRVAANPTAADLADRSAYE